MSRRVMSMFRWPAVDLTSYLPSSFFRPPEFSFPSLNFAAGWTTQGIREVNFWVVDNLLWVVVTVVESVALLAFLCCFFALCGCTL